KQRSTRVSAASSPTSSTATGASALGSRARGFGLAGGVLRFDTAAHGLHIQRFGCTKHLLQSTGAQRSSFREHDDVVAKDHQRRNRSNAELRGDLLLIFGIDLGK